MKKVTANVIANDMCNFLIFKNTVLVSTSNIGTII